MCRRRPMSLGFRCNLLLEESQLRQRYRGANNLASNYKILVRVNYVQDQLTACCFKLSLNFAGGSNQLKGFFGHFSAGYLQLASCTALPPLATFDHLTIFQSFGVSCSIKPNLCAFNCVMCFDESNITKSFTNNLNFKLKSGSVLLFRC